MGSRKKSSTLSIYLALIAGSIAVAGCAQHTTTSSPPAPQTLQTLQSAGAPLQPYTVVAQLPAKPAVVEDHRRALHLTYHDSHYCLADSAGDYYDCARDSRGNLYPAYYDQEIGKYCPLYYDGDRDRYYCAVRENGRFYRQYRDDPSRLYYDDRYDYDDYQPPAQDRPVVYVQNNYYNYQHDNQHPRGHHNNDWLAAIPVVAIAFVALTHNGHHDHPALAANNAPPRPAVIYRSSPPSARPIIVSQKQTVIVQQAPVQRPTPPNGHPPIAITMQPHPKPTVPPPSRQTAAKPPQTSKPAPVATGRPFFAHKQPKPSVAGKPAPKSTPIAAKPATIPIVKASKPAPTIPGKPQVARLPVGVHTHPMILAKPTPKMAIRPPAPPKQSGVERHVAQRPVMMQSKPQAAPPAKIAMPAPSHPSPRTATHVVVPPKTASPPAYHRTIPAQQASPAHQSQSAAQSKPALPSRPAFRMASPTKPAQQAATSGDQHGNAKQKKDHQADKPTTPN